MILLMFMCCFCLCFRRQLKNTILEKMFGIEKSIKLYPIIINLIFLEAEEKFHDPREHSFYYDAIVKLTVIWYCREPKDTRHFSEKWNHYEN